MGLTNYLTDTEVSVLNERFQKKLKEDSYVTVGQVWDMIFEISDGRVDLRNNGRTEISIANWFDDDEEVEWGL